MLVNIHTPPILVPRCQENSAVPAVVVDIFEPIHHIGQEAEEASEQTKSDGPRMGIPSSNMCDSRHGSLSTRRAIARCWSPSQGSEGGRIHECSHPRSRGLLGNLGGRLDWKSLLIYVLPLWWNLVHLGRHIWVESWLRRLDVDYLGLTWLVWDLAIVLGLSRRALSHSLHRLLHWLRYLRGWSIFGQRLCLLLVGGHFEEERSGREERSAEDFQGLRAIPSPLSNEALSARVACLKAD